MVFILPHIHTIFFNPTDLSEQADTTAKKAVNLGTESSRQTYFEFLHIG